MGEFIPKTSNRYWGCCACVVKDIIPEELSTRVAYYRGTFYVTPDSSVRAAYRNATGNTFSPSSSNGYDTVSHSGYRTETKNYTSTIGNANHSLSLSARKSDIQEVIANGGSITNINTSWVVEDISYTASGVESTDKRYIADYDSVGSPIYDTYPETNSFSRRTSLEGGEYVFYQTETRESSVVITPATVRAEINEQTGELSFFSTPAVLGPVGSTNETVLGRVSKIIGSNADSPLRQMGIIAAGGMVTSGGATSGTTLNGVSLRTDTDGVANYTRSINIGAHSASDSTSSSRTSNQFGGQLVLSSGYNTQYSRSSNAMQVTLSKSTAFPAINGSLDIESDFASHWNGYATENKAAPNAPFSTSVGFGGVASQPDGGSHSVRALTNYPIIGQNSRPYATSVKNSDGTDRIFTTTGNISIRNIGGY